MKAIFLRAICQRKQGGKNLLLSELQLPLANAEDGRKMAQERFASNTFLEAFITLLLEVRQKKAQKWQENILKIHLSLPVLLLLF